MEAGLVVKSGNAETIVKQMKLAAHMPLTCGTTFTHPLGKMVERKHVIALYTMRCFAGMHPDNLWRVCTNMASPKSTVHFREAGKGPPRWGNALVSVSSSQQTGFAHPPFKTYAVAL